MPTLCFIYTNMFYTANFVPISILIFSIIGNCLCDAKFNSTKDVNVPPTSSAPTTTLLSTEVDYSTKSSVKLLQTSVPLNARALTTREDAKTTKGTVTTEDPTTVRKVTTQVYASTKGSLKSARRQKLNTTSSALGNAVHTSTRLQDRLGALDCDLPVLPRESRLWRGNETHELNLPVTVSCFYDYYYLILWRTS